MDLSFGRLRAEGHACAREKGYTGVVAEAYAEGYAEGVIKAYAQVITHMLKRGKTPESITEDIGIPIEDVMSVVESIKNERE